MKGFLFTLLGTIGLFCAVTVFPVQASAQDTYRNNTASAGTLMAAVMQQVGYHAQAKILADLGNCLGWTAALVYLLVLVGIIISVVVMGFYRGALWVLVGPPLFLYFSGVALGGAVGNTISGAGVEWRFGAFDDTEHDKAKIHILKDPEVGKKGDVSFVFHKYNVMVSEIYQKVIRVITSADDDEKKFRTQMLFMARQRMLEELMAVDIKTPGLDAMATYFSVHCAQEVGYARIVSRGLKDNEFRKTSGWQEAFDQYCNRFGREDKEFAPGPWQRWWKDKGLPGETGVSEEDQDKLFFLKEDRPISCQQMWEGLMVGAKLATSSEFALLRPTLMLSSSAEAWNEVIEGVGDKLLGDGGVYEEIKCVEGSSMKGAAFSTMNSKQFNRLTTMVSALMVKKALTSDPISQLLNTASHRSGIRPAKTMPIGQNSEEKAEIIRRQGAHQFSISRHFGAFTLITLLPYMQGMILYVLAIAYPFVCITLLIPGRLESLLLWFGAMAWVKSWDVGWAMVMVVDEVLWELMPNSSFFNGEKEADYDNAVNVLDLAFQQDHSYHMATYWVILGSMVGGVPVLSANIFLGTKKALGNMAKKAMSDLSDTYAMGGADWTVARHVYAATRIRERGAHREMYMQSLGSMNSFEMDAKKLDKDSGQGLQRELKNSAPTERKARAKMVGIE